MIKVRLVIAMLLAVPNAHAELITYDSVEDFSIAENSDASRWSYRFADDQQIDGDYELLDRSTSSATAFSPALEGWGVSGRNNPGVLANRTGAASEMTFLPGNFIPNDSLYLHPGGPGSDPGSTLGMIGLSWLSPVSGLANIFFSVSDLLPTGGDGVDYFVVFNSSTGPQTTLATGFVSTSAGDSGILNNVSVAPGDRIDFLISGRSNVIADATGLTATVQTSPVPEPSSLALSLLSLYLIANRRACKKPVRPKSRRL